MPGPLSNPRYERFAQERFKGLGPTDAHEAAGYARNSGNAAALNAKQCIQTRIAELQTMAAAQIVRKAAVIDKSYVLQQAHRMYEASANAAIPAGEDGSFDHQAAGVAARFLDQIGRHHDVQAWKDTSDLNVHITLDASIARLAQLGGDLIEGDWSDVTAPNSEHGGNIGPE